MNHWSLSGSYCSNCCETFGTVGRQINLSRDSFGSLMMTGCFNSTGHWTVRWRAARPGLGGLGLFSGDRPEERPIPQVYPNGRSQ